MGARAGEVKLKAAAMLCFGMIHACTELSVLVCQSARSRLVQWMAHKLNLEEARYAVDRFGYPIVDVGPRPWI